MKKLITLLALVCATSAFASPKAGDYLKLTGTASDGVKTVPAVFEMTAVSCTAADCVVQQDVTLDGTKNTQIDTVAMADIASEEAAADLVSMCASVGYVAENIKYAGGTMTACKIEQPNVTFWIAAVPFGVVKIQGEVESGIIADLLISDVKRGP